MPTHLLPRHIGLRPRAVALPALLALLFYASARIASAQTVDQVAPQVKATGYVTDLAGVLSQSGRAPDRCALHRSEPENPGGDRRRHD